MAKMKLLGIINISDRFVYQSLLSIIHVSLSMTLLQVV